MEPDATGTEAIDHFWEVARRHAKLAGVPTYTGENPLELLRPPAWAFGATPAQADRLLALVLDGTKTSTASAYADYEAEGEPLPEPGTLGIVLDGSGRPRALVVTTEVSVVPFADVGAEQDGQRLSPGDPVVLERFEVLYP
jgi:uncharacterized protein YhfF